jgi:pilus assembly protein CpaB
MSNDRLSPTPLQRLRRSLGERSWQRTVRLRRAAAAALVVLALVLALAPRAGPSVVPVLVAAAELTAGATIHGTDLAVRSWPADIAPAGALRDPGQAEGRVLVGAAHAGEPLTDLRVVGASPDPDGGATVPVRVADAGVAALLVPGSRVDVVTAGPPGSAVGDAPAVLAADAKVLAVLAEEKGVRGRLVMVATTRETASRVAVAALADQVTLTLR